MWPFDVLAIWTQVLWAWVANLFHLHVKKRCVDIPEWSIVSAHVIDDVTGDFGDISNRFHLWTWEEDVMDEFGWDNPRVDIRYLHTSPLGKVTKYRMILRPGDFCMFPPLRPKNPLAGGLRGIISATLVPYAHIPDAREVDVTTRLKKYAGPNKDFYHAQGLEVRVLDCFPFDDPDQLAERFESLTILDSSRLVSQEMYVFSLKTNDRIQIS